MDPDRDLHSAAQGEHEPGVARSPPEAPFCLQPIQTHDTTWQPDGCRVALNVTLDACIVPDSVGAARVDSAHLVVLDDFIGEAERVELLDFITEPGWDPQRGPPPAKWERATRDRADAAPTWGLRAAPLRRLAACPLRAKLEVHSRLARLYPGYLIAHMPSDVIQAAARGARLPPEHAAEQDDSQPLQQEQQQQPHHQQQQQQQQQWAQTCSAGGAAGSSAEDEADPLGLGRAGGGSCGASAQQACSGGGGAAPPVDSGDGGAEAQQPGSSDGGGGGAEQQQGRGGGDEGSQPGSSSDGGGGVAERARSGGHGSGRQAGSSGGHCGAAGAGIGRHIRVHGARAGVAVEAGGRAAGGSRGGADEAALGADGAAQVGERGCGAGVVQGSPQQLRPVVGGGGAAGQPRVVVGGEDAETAWGGEGAANGAEAEEEEVDEAEEECCEAPSDSIVDCNQYVANAPVHGDTYGWHVDADPSTLPYPSPWTDLYGHYVNREPGRPLFVSLLLYLNRTWEREWDAETLFLDTPSDCGVVVRPRAYRAVLMDQDVLHRLSVPSLAAGGRPRYSLVWKLVFVPRQAAQRVSLARPEWGRPAAFGSAAVLERVVAGLAAAARGAGVEAGAGVGKRQRAHGD